MAPSVSDSRSLNDQCKAMAPLTGAANLSIIICTKNRPVQLDKAISSIRASGDLGRQAEIVVVEETDSPREKTGVRYVQLPPTSLGFGYARNVGVQAAQGEIILFTDDDCEVEQGWPEKLTKPFQDHPEILGVAGAVLVKDCGAIGYAENILGFPGGGLRYLHDANQRVIPTRFLSTCNCAYRRSALLEAGGFEREARYGGEDFLLAERVAAIGPCVYAPNAIVYHQARGKLTSVFHWFLRRGRSEIALLRLTQNRAGFARFLLRSSWSLRAVILLALLARWPVLLWGLPAAPLLYGAVILWRYRFALHYEPFRRGWWMVPLVKVVMDCGAEVGRWRGLLSVERA